jgi:hypothetical protein
MRFSYFIFLFAVSYLNAAPIPGKLPVSPLDAANLKARISLTQMDSSKEASHPLHPRSQTPILGYSTEQY